MKARAPGASRREVVLRLEIIEKGLAGTVGDALAIRATNQGPAPP